MTPAPDNCEPPPRPRPSASQRAVAALAGLCALAVVGFIAHLILSERSVQRHHARLRSLDGELIEIVIEARPTRVPSDGELRDVVLRWRVRPVGEWRALELDSAVSISDIRDHYRAMPEDFRPALRVWSKRSLPPDIVRSFALTPNARPSAPLSVENPPQLPLSALDLETRGQGDKDLILSVAFVRGEAVLVPTHWSRELRDIYSRGNDPLSLILNELIEPAQEPGAGRQR